MISDQGVGESEKAVKRVRISENIPPGPRRQVGVLLDPQNSHIRICWGGVDFVVGIKVGI